MMKLGYAIFRHVNLLFLLSFGYKITKFNSLAGTALDAAQPLPITRISLGWGDTFFHGRENRIVMTGYFI